ncbi:DUF2795 domain-containing protein [Actinomycetospora lemnae]|uniref:DUF2795 domain-containing protein n=1 Tax=Actinomycetospora lemnae TaxID=3019891 RepID=A0ABT5SZB8_9PSEU|nr:DUF2795 domain-containing protein [Actinomycetospora sp. DW7H6]MDD7968219.1 DUF2795 domain-containing protein [Actinomycetospora sp. DW7H6]
MSASTTRDRLDAALDGVSFPADRDTLVEAARRRDDEQTARALRAIPPVEYGSPKDVVASVSLAEDDHPDEIPPEAR